MGAYVEHGFERGFILDEERLRKIHDLIENRISKYPTPLSLRYIVFRGDSFSYQTSSVDDVVNEDNEDWRAITMLELFASEEEGFTFRLTFSKRGVFVRITGDDRDDVFLLFSDLREYIRNEVLSGWRIDRLTARLLGLIFTILVLLGALYFYTRVTYDPHLFSEALSTNDLAKKLNFLIQESARSYTGGRSILVLTGVLLVALLGGEGLPTVWNAAFPTNLFLFGKRKVTFDKRRRLLANIFWVVIVGLIVSALAGLFVWRLTSK
jgi:hypothetical protein